MADLTISKKNEVYLVIDGEPHILAELSDYFTFRVDNKHMRGPRYKHWDGSIRLFNAKDHTIYVGLVHRITQWADSVGYAWEFKNNKFYGLPFEDDEKITRSGVEYYMGRVLKGMVPRDYQIEATYQAMKYYRKTILSPTSSGKSAIIYTLARFHTASDRRTLIVVPSTNLVEQMTKDFAEYGWDTDEHVHKIYSGYEKVSDKDVVISTWQSLQEQKDSYFEQFDCIMVDEAHGCAAKELTSLMKKCRDIKYRVGLTGTLDNNSKSNAAVVEGLFGPVYNTIRTKELMEAGLVAQLTAHVIVLQHEPISSFLDYPDEIEFLCASPERNAFLADLAIRLSGNSLLLTGRIDTHAIPLYELISRMTNRPVHLIHGGVDAEDREQVRSILESSDGNIVIASYGTMSTGVSIKKLDNIIFATPSKSRIRVLQSIGRGLRKGNGKTTAKLFDIADDLGCRNITLGHLKDRLAYYVDEEFTYDIKTIHLNS